MNTHSFARQLGKLAKLRLIYEGNSAQQKLETLQSLSKLNTRSATSLMRYHEILLFLSAFPDSPAVRRLAEQQLKQFEQRIAKAERTSSSISRSLKDSAISGTSTDLLLSLSASIWIVNQFHEQVNVSLINDKTEEEWGSLLRECTWLPIADAVLHQVPSTAQISTLASPRPALPTWLSELFAHDPCAEVFATAFFEKQAPDINWHLAYHNSRTGLRLPKLKRRASDAAKIVYHRSLRRSFDDLAVLIKRRLPRPITLSSKDRELLLKFARTALYSRGRETDPITYANPHDVTIFELEDGIAIALFGSIASRRRPLETFIGYIATKNGHPIAYGGSWMLGAEADIGINIFDTFRGGESGLLFAQILRVYHQHYCIESFEVEPYQFGKDNEEAIQSGAFWFYWRLGFEPVRRDLLRLAKRESRKILTGSGYRTPSTKLRKLAADRIRLCLGAKEPRQCSVYSCAIAILDYVRTKYDGDWADAYEHSTRTIARRLGIRSMTNWKLEEAQAFRHLALYFAQFPQIKNWSRIDKENLARLLRAKGGDVERDFQLLLLQHSRARECLKSLSKRGDSIANRLRR